MTRAGASSGGPDRTAVAARTRVELDAEGAAVVPGFVDAHTHLAFAGDRDDEIRQRLAGRQLPRDRGRRRRHRAPAWPPRAPPRAKSWRDAIAGRLDEMLLQGTTTAEVKSGYGLETAAEMRSLEAIRAAARRHPVTVVPTFLGAHEVPVEHRGRPRALPARC